MPSWATTRSEVAAEIDQSVVNEAKAERVVPEERLDEEDFQEDVVVEAEAEVVVERNSTLCPVNRLFDRLLSSPLLLHLPTCILLVLFTFTST